MKRMALLSGIVISAALFTGCAYKTECGVDGCGQHYVDTTYRTYPKTLNCNNKCNTNPLELRSKCEPCTVNPVVKKEEPAVCVMPKAPKPVLPKNTPILKHNSMLKISVVGQGVAPCKGACSPAQAYAMAKRAAIADSYRLIAEKVKGVYVEGDDYIKNMMVKRSTIRTSVAATVRNANIIETTFKEGLCEVEMEIKLSYADLYK